MHGHACKQHDNAEHQTENQCVAEYLTGPYKIACTDKVGHLHREAYC